MPKPNPKSCYQCRHGRASLGSRDPALYRCWQGLAEPDLPPASTLSNAHYTDGFSAYLMRKAGGRCGPEALLFEPHQIPEIGT